MHLLPILAEAITWPDVGVMVVIGLFWAIIVNGWPKCGGKDD